MAFSSTEMMPFHCDPRGADSAGKRKQKVVLHQQLLENKVKNSNYQTAEM